MLGRTLLLALTLLGLALPAWAGDEPRTWPIRFSEIYHFEKGAVSQITLSWEGLRARRFFLRLRSPRSFDAKLVRERDGTFLYSERRARLHEALIPWGRDEVAHLSVSSRHDEGVHLTLEVATDPSEEGLAVYGLHVNRFLELYREGDHEDALEALERALEEEPTDETARMLMERLWESQGLTEPPTVVATDEDEDRLWQGIADEQRILRWERRVRRALREVGADSARALLPSPEELESAELRAAIHRLDGEIALHQSNFSRAAFAFYDALDEAETPAHRREIYRQLVRANLALGNRAQAREIVERAVAEAFEEADRAEIRAWLESPTP